MSKNMMFLDKKNPGYLQPLPRKEQETFPGSSLYHIRIRRAVRRHGNKKVWKDTLTAQMAHFPTKYLSRQLTLKMMNKAKNTRTMNRRQLESNAKVIFIGKNQAIKKRRDK